MIMAKRIYSDAFSFVSLSPTHPFPVLTMDPITPPAPAPATTDRRTARPTLANTPNKFAGTISPSSQPVGSTQRALQVSLTGNIVFADETIVEAIFKPSCVDNQVIVGIITEMTHDKDLKTARGSVLSNNVAEMRKYESLVRNRMLTFFW
jgi:hypothetical protein